MYFCTNDVWYIRMAYRVGKNQDSSRPHEFDVFFQTKGCRCCETNTDYHYTFRAPGYEELLAAIRCDRKVFKYIIDGGEHSLTWYIERGQTECDRISKALAFLDDCRKIEPTTDTDARVKRKVYDNCKRRWVKVKRKHKPDVVGAPQNVPLLLEMGPNPPNSGAE